MSDETRVIERGREGEGERGNERGNEAERQHEIAGERCNESNTYIYI